MPEGRTPGRHDGRDAEVRRFSPLPLRRHPSSRARRHLLVRVQSLVTPIFLLRSIRGCSTLFLVPSMIYLTVARSTHHFPLFLRGKSRENHHPHLRQGILSISVSSRVFFLSSSFSFSVQLFFLPDNIPAQRQHNDTVVKSYRIRVQAFLRSDMMRLAAAREALPHLSPSSAISVYYCGRLSG